MASPTNLFHAAPLHYLPHILQDGALYAKSVLASRGIAPRVTAQRRDRMLGLADYVHLSLDARTPLLADKLRKGYPHALLVFDREHIFQLPEVALLPYNTKAWHARGDFALVTDRNEQAALLRRHEVTGRHPSLEVLVKYGLDFSGLQRVAFAARDECEAITTLMQALRLECAASMKAEPKLLLADETYHAATRDAMMAYFAACAQEGRVLPPPGIPFD